MSYYGMGDYYLTGDPGLFSSLGSFVKGVASGVGGFLTGGPLGAVAGIAAGTRSSSRGPGPQLQLPVQPVPGLGGMVQRMAPGGKTGYYVDASGVVKKKRRRMNYANGKALNRANRRVDGFVKLARRSLKHTNYKIVSKSAGSGRRSISVRETGPGSVTVR